MLASQQQKRRRHSVAQRNSTRVAPPNIRHSSRFEDKQRRFSYCIDSGPNTGRRRLLSDVMNTGHGSSSGYKPAKSAVMCVGNIPTTAPQFYYTTPVERYELPATTAARSSVDLSSPKRHHRRFHKESLPPSSQDLGVPPGSLWKMPSRGVVTRGSRTRQFSDRREMLSGGLEEPSMFAQPSFARRAQNVQLTCLPYLPSESSKFTDIGTRPTPRRRLSQSQVSHGTALVSDRGGCLGGSSETRTEEDEDAEEDDDELDQMVSSVSQDSLEDFSRTSPPRHTGTLHTSNHTTSDSVSASCSRSMTHASDPGMEETVSSSPLSPAMDRNYVTFIEPGEFDFSTESTWQRKIVICFAKNFWTEDFSSSSPCVPSPLEQRIRQAFHEGFVDPKERQVVLQHSVRLIEEGFLSCGKGLLEVERSLHRLLTHPPGAGPLPSYARAGGGEPMPITVPKLEAGGPSYFVYIRRPSTKAANKNINILLEDPKIVYLSDCYDRLTSKQDIYQAWYYLVRSGTAALMSQKLTRKNFDPVIVSLCTRHFVRYAYVTFTRENSMRHGVTVFPLSRQLRWDQSSDREDISALSHYIAAWVRCH